MIAAWCLIALLQVSGSAKGQTIKTLPASTRPVASLPGLKSSDIVSVSETRIKGDPVPTRVFRYSFRGAFADVLKQFRSTLTAKDGWEFWQTESHEGDFWRQLKRGPLMTQGILIFDARLQRSRWSPTGWAPLPPSRSRGWVWISYNERLRKTP